MRALALAAATALALGTAAAGDIKIGMITTLSGGGAHLGIDVRDGFALALAEAGRDDIALLIRDDARQPDLAKQFADELVQREGVDLMTGLIWSNLAMAVIPSVTRGGTLYLSPNAGPSQLAGRLCHENYFNVAWQNDNLSEAMAAHLSAEGIDDVFILAPNYPSGQDQLRAFKAFYTGTVAGEIYTKLGQTDYAVEIAQIREADPAAVFFFLPGGMGIAFMKQYSAAGVGKPVYGPAFSFDEVILGAVGDAALGVRNTSQWSHDLDNEANRAFVAAFREAYGRTPTLYASQGYDTARLILSALGKAEISDIAAFRAALRAADFASVRGKFRFNTNQHPIQDIYLREVVAGEGKPTNRVLGVALADHGDAHAQDCPL